MLNFQILEQKNDVPAGFEEGIYLTPCPANNEILRDLHEVDMQHAIEYLVKTQGVFSTFKTMAEQFKAVSGMEIRL